MVPRGSAVASPPQVQPAVHNSGITNLQFIDFVPYVTVPLLAATVLGFVLFITKRAERRGHVERRQARALQGLVAVWAL